MNLLKSFKTLSKSVFVVILILTFLHQISFGQTLFIPGTATWNSSNTNFSITSGGAQNTVWSNGRTLQLESTPAITLNGFNPRIAGMNCTSTGSLTSNASEKIYLSGTSTPTIDVSSSQTLTLSTALSGGMGFTKTGTGTLTLGQGTQIGNSFHGTVTINGGTINYPDNTNVAPASSLRHNTISLGVSGTLTYTGSTNASDMRIGTLTGSGTITASGAAANGIFSLVTTSGSSSATITTGSGGITFRGMGGATQTLTGNTTAVAGALNMNGFRLADGTYTNNVTLSGSTTNFSNSAANYAIRGAKLLLDNSTNNSTTRLGNSATTQILTFTGGGELYLLGNSSGTTQNVGSSTTKALVLNGGAIRIVAETPSGASARAQIGFAGSASAFTLRDQTYMTVDFVGVGGTLGGSGTTDPRIVFTGGGSPFTGSGTLLANTNGGATIGWATANGNSFATWGSNGAAAISFTSATTNTDLQGGTSSSVFDFAPTSTQTLSAGATNAAMRISPNGGTTLAVGTNTITTAAIMLDGSTDFTISGTGNSMSGSGTKYLYVNNPSTTLFMASNIAASANPFNKSGRGFWVLNGTSSQLGFSSSQNINLLQGVMRVTATNMGGSTSTGGANTTFRFFGGVLELDGGFNLTRALDLSGTSSGGGIIFDAGATTRGNGGFSAINGNSTVTFVTTVGGSTASTLQWNDNAWLSNGYSLILGSSKADSRITISNDIQLDNGTAGNYNAREIYVNDNTGSSNDAGRLSGAISGSINSDLLKTGPGTLELSGTNTYNGNTLIQAGTLSTISSGALPSATSVILLGGTLQLGATATVTDVILNTGSTLNLNGNTINISGNLVYNGGTITGSGTVVFNGTSQQYIDGNAITFPSNVTINNSNGINTQSNTTITGTLNQQSGNISINATTLTLNGDYTRTSGSISSSGSASISIGGTGALTNSLFFDATTLSTTNRFTNFTLSRGTSPATGSATLGSALEITGSVTLSNGTLNTGGFLTLISNASGTARIGTITASNADISGNVTAQRFVPSGNVSTRRYRMLSSPTQNFTWSQLIDNMFITGTGGATNGFDASTYNSPSIFTYNEDPASTRGWKEPSSITSSVTSGSGMLVFIRGDRTLTSPDWYTPGQYPAQNSTTIDFTSQPVNKGTISPTITWNTVSGLTDDGWNLIGNPYPSQIDWTSSGITKNNIENTYWCYDPQSGNYVSASSGVIPISQGFFIHADGNGTPSITFNETAKVSSTATNYFKKQTPDLEIRMIKDSFNFDRAWLSINPSSSKSFNQKEDSRKFPNSSINFGFIENSIKIQRNMVPLLQSSDTFDIFANAPIGNYTMQFLDIQSSIPSNKEIYLYDKFSNTLNNIRNQPSFLFNISGSTASSGNRFQLILSDYTNLPVSLIEFGGEKNDLTNSINLHWSTASEINNDFYTLLRSNDNKKFEKIAAIKGKENITYKSIYGYTDAILDMKTPVWYYKLLQTDLDGTTHEIGTVAIKNQVELSDKLYSTFPNPFKESIRISNNGDNGAKKLEIMDITGNTVMSIDFVEDKKNSEFVVNTTELKEGVYLIKISGDSGNAFLQKMVKIN